MSTVPVSATITEEDAARPRSLNIARALLVPATMIVILAVVLLLLMTPFWIHPALSATTADYFATPALAHELSDRTVSELFFGPGTFTYFGADEAAHMRDVRVVLWGFLIIAAASAGLLLWQLVRHGREPGTWRSISRGGIALAIALVVVGVFAIFAFEAVFELFHQVFFPGGNWAFPASSWLIRLYPYAFWEWTAGALGVLGIGTGLVVWRLARRRAQSLERSAH